MTKTLKKPPKGAKRAGVIERADVALGSRAASFRNAPGMQFAKLVSEIADQPQAIALGVATLVGELILRKPRLVRAGIRMLLSEAVATGAKALVKRHVARTRPHKMLEDGRYALSKDAAGSKDDGPWNSFPSGHTAGAFAVGRAFVREFPAAAPVVATGVAAIALLQPFIGAHFPSDVAAGAATGLASEALVDAVIADRLG